jgi:hypothetical protein
LECNHLYSVSDANSRILGDLLADDYGVTSSSKYSLDTANTIESILRLVREELARWFAAENDRTPCLRQKIKSALRVINDSEKIRGVPVTDEASLPDRWERYLRHRRSELAVEAITIVPHLLPSEILRLSRPGVILIVMVETEPH